MSSGVQNAPRAPAQSYLIAYTLLVVTVVWNPWSDQARELADFGDDELPEYDLRGSGPRIEPGDPIAGHRLWS